MYLFLAVQHVRSQFPDQGSDPHPQHWKAQSLNPWTAREELFIIDASLPTS